MSNLRKIVAVDKEKCVNCHACIGVCPVKLCNDGSGDHVTIDADLCIGCGSCIPACTHGARYGIDDMDAFLRDLEQGVPMVAIAAPSVAAHFPGTYRHLNGWLKSLGIAAVFDVSFGAELTIKSYVEYIRRHKPSTVIAQPCPAIVNYIEIHQPELMEFLAPADSPMVHTMKMIRSFYPGYREHRIAVVSPCYAKRREFDAVGMGDYNLTYITLEDHLERHGVDLAAFPETAFDNRPAERAVLFSTPGGLLRTLNRENPSLRRKARKIEGPEAIYPYLKSLPRMIDRGIAPPLIDCLNCELGCNGGTGTRHTGMSPDELEHLVEERNREMRRRYRAVGPFARLRSRAKVRRTVNRYWEAGLYDRTYEDRSGGHAPRTPDRRELQRVFERMHKTSEKDVLNCGACGYGRCEAMAEAIFNGLNKPENCFHYERTTRYAMASHFIRKLKDLAGELTRSLHGLTGAGDDTGGDELVNIKEIGDITGQMREYINQGADYVEASLGKMAEIEKTSVNTVQGIKNLGDQIKSIWEIVGIINAIAAQTKIIAFNAELEASSAGESGKNFEIVASEIRRLADSTVVSTQEIKEKIDEIQRASNALVLASEEESRQIHEGLDLSDQMKRLVDNLSAFSEHSTEKITRSINLQIQLFDHTLGDLNKLSEDVDRFEG